MMGTLVLNWSKKYIFSKTQWRHRSIGFFSQILLLSFRFYKCCWGKDCAKLTGFPLLVMKDMENNLFNIFWSVRLLKMGKTNRCSKACLFKVNNKNARKWCKICSELTEKTPKQRHWRHFVVFMVNFERISHLFFNVSIANLSMYLFSGKIVSKNCRELIADSWNLWN